MWDILSLEYALHVLRPIQMNEVNGIIFKFFKF